VSDPYFYLFLCPCYGESMTIIAWVTNGDSIQRLLTYLGEPTQRRRRRNGEAVGAAGMLPARQDAFFSGMDAAGPRGSCQEQRFGNEVRGERPEMDASLRSEECREVCCNTNSIRA
jgi:hypothetical protein